MTIDHEHYAYRVIWSEEDGEYVGLCAEFPSLSHLEESRVGALEGIVRLVGEVVGEMRAAGEPVPEPVSLRDYSGKLQLRMPPHRHRILALRAMEEGVSLNRYINARLEG